MTLVSARHCRGVDNPVRLQRVSYSSPAQIRVTSPAMYCIRTAVSLSTKQIKVANKETESRNKQLS